ncbi:hypothetical protein VL14_15170 [Cytobacillus firmus]|nr:hypothetical protein VL14_15170 [Cytobacillus firmus]
MLLLSENKNELYGSKTVYPKIKMSYLQVISSDLKVKAGSSSSTSIRQPYLHPKCLTAHKNGLSAQKKSFPHIKFSYPHRK